MKRKKQKKEENPAYFPRVAVRPEIHSKLKELADAEDGKSIYRFCEAIFKNFFKSRGIFLPEK